MTKLQLAAKTLFAAVGWLLLLPTTLKAEVDKTDSTYLVLRDSLTHAFNDGDSARFFVAVKNLEDYCLSHDDLHAYYTQRCNEIVFLLNRKSIFEAYKLATRLSQELRERKLDKEMFMAINMMGHIYNYCGNKESARQCFHEVLRRMQKEGYTEGMPPIFMNLVQVEIDENPEEAMRLLDEAERYATTPARRADIDAYRTLHCFQTGDMKGFSEGYERYRKRLDEGLNSVHGRTLEIYHLTSLGRTAEAVELARSSVSGDEMYGTLAEIYEYAGSWQEALQMMKQKERVQDSINSVILANSMQGIENQLSLYDAERKVARQRILTLIGVAATLLAIIVALTYITITRRRHMKELTIARDRALESDRMKSAFISNVSHEVRTPLNIIGGFMQVMSDDTMQQTDEERRHMADLVIRNTKLITNFVDEMLELSLNDSEYRPKTTDKVSPLQLCREVIDDRYHELADGVELRLNCDVPDDFTWYTNLSMAKRILSALFDNAVKNTDHGQILIKVIKSASAVIFSVTDTGCGIPQKDAERVFEKFEKLDDFKDGLGLGLPMARMLAEKLGGSLELDGSYTSGARFVASLPLS